MILNSYCAKQIQEVVENDDYDDFDDILAEILAEEQERNAALGIDDSEKNLGGKKKLVKKSANKKKKNNASQKSEL